MGKTLAEKIWGEHIVRSAAGEPDLIYIDLHLIHEVTSPQAFDGLRLAGRTVRRTDLTIATEDHNTPTLNIDKPIADPVSKLQVDTLRANCAEFLNRGAVERIPRRVTEHRRQVRHGMRQREDERVGIGRARSDESGVSDFPGVKGFAVF